MFRGFCSATAVRFLGFFFIGDLIGQFSQAIIGSLNKEGDLFGQVSNLLQIAP